MKRAIFVLAITAAVVFPAYAQWPRDGKPVQGEPKQEDKVAKEDESVAVADVLQNVSTYINETICIEGEIQGIKKSSNDATFIIELDKKLWCEVKKDYVLDKYCKTTRSESSSGSKTRYTLVISSAGDAEIVRSVKNGSSTSKSKKTIFIVGEKIKIKGTIMSVSDSRTLLKNCIIVPYPGVRRW